MTNLPKDDPLRALVVSDRSSRPHVSVAGDTYTILVSSKETEGRYCLIDMHVAPGGGPPLHRHDFEEMFTILEGELELTFRGEKKTAKAGSTVNIPSNAAHAFKNVSGSPVRMLCMCTPAGQDEFFLAVGDLVEGPTSPPPKLSESEQKARAAKAKELGPKYKNEILV